MNVYGSSLWKFNNHMNIGRFCVSWRKVIRRIWKIPYRTHNAIVYLINKCNSIVNILEKRRFKFLWNLLNSENVLFSRICKYSMCNTDSTIGENIRYFIYKYDLLYDDWSRDLNRIYEKLDAHVHALCALNARQLATGDWYFLWATGSCFTGRPRGDRIL